MEKKSFVTLVMGGVGGLLFSLGMCMALLPEWNMFNAGVGFGMCMVMVFEGMMIWGILVGIVGIVLLLCLIPMFFGWKDSKKDSAE